MCNDLRVGLVHSDPLVYKSHRSQSRNDNANHSWQSVITVELMSLTKDYIIRFSEIYVAFGVSVYVILKINCFICSNKMNPCTHLNRNHQMRTKVKWTLGRSSNIWKNAVSQNFDNIISTSIVTDWTELILLDFRTSQFQKGVGNGWFSGSVNVK